MVGEKNLAGKQPLNPYRGLNINMEKDYEINPPQGVRGLTIAVLGLGEAGSYFANDLCLRFNS